MEIKYTSDGKKVVVLGDLNNKEKIVQEIFIVGGQEIPSGENFITSILHDAPAESWKAKRIREIDTELKLKEEKYKDTIQKYRRTYQQQTKILKSKIDSIKKTIPNVHQEALDTFIMYTSGEAKYIIEQGYGCPIIMTMDEWKESDNDGELRLISIFGRSNGDLTYAIGQYSDYSGSRSKFIPVRTLDEALKILKDYITDSKEYYEATIKEARKHNIQLDKTKLNVFINKRRTELNKNIANYNKSIMVWADMINKLEKI